MSAGQQSPFYRVHEVAQILGCSEGAVRARISRKQIPVTRLGESVLVPRAEFDAMLNELLLSARRCGGRDLPRPRPRRVPTSSTAAPRRSGTRRRHGAHFNSGQATTACGMSRATWSQRRQRPSPVPLTCSCR